MSSPSTTPAADVPVSWQPLSVNERRVLGVLVEKAKTTPEAYPLTLNALNNGCNQKSNRDPMLDLNDLDVEEALASCQKKNLAFKITGSRVDRWKHNLYDTWSVGKVELAILGELLLRGAQTEGELRGRASRMEPIDDLTTLRAILKTLAERKLVVYLTPENRRGTTLTHGFHLPQELARLRAARPLEADEEALPVSAPVSRANAASSPPVEDARVIALQSEVAELRGQVAELQSKVAALSAQLQSMRDALGV